MEGNFLFIDLGIKIEEISIMSIKDIANSGVVFFTIEGSVSVRLIKQKPILNEKNSCYRC